MKIPTKVVGRNFLPPAWMDEKHAGTGTHEHSIARREYFLARDCLSYFREKTTHMQNAVSSIVLFSCASADAFRRRAILRDRKCH